MIEINCQSMVQVSDTIHAVCIMLYSIVSTAFPETGMPPLIKILIIAAVVKGLQLRVSSVN